MSFVATEPRLILLTTTGPSDGLAIFPPPDEWSEDPVAGTPGNSLEDLEANIVASLATDIRVEQSELAAGESDRRGWWGDSFPEILGDEWGGRMWLVDRGKISAESDASGVLSPDSVARWSKACLNWMVEDGVLSSVRTEAERNGANRIDLTVTHVRLDPEDPIAMRFAFLWSS